ncbi:MAG: hypothetical protein RL026_2236 [Pseudomonadota bacterium]
MLPDDHYLEQLGHDLLARLDLRRSSVDVMDDRALQDWLESVADDVVSARPPPDGLDAAEARRRLLQEALGLGRLDELLADDSVTEIMVNAPDCVFVERHGRLCRYRQAFRDERDLRRVVERLLASSGRRVDEASPMVDARLTDGSRLNVVLPPLALAGAAITIRKFARQRLGMDELIERGALSIDMAAFLAMAIENRCNLVVSGGTGSGKTTLLNILSGYIPEGERIITIEDAAELRLQHANLVALQARPHNVEGRGAISIRDLLRNALRMRPDRLVIGECRGGEALDMLQAMNTGHDGSLTTAHANSPRDLLARLEVMALMSGVELPLAAVREQVAAGIDIIVQQSRFSCGTRRITQITEITGLEGGRIQMQDLFRFVPRGRDDSGRSAGHFTHCDNVPQFAERMEPAMRSRMLALFQEPSP